MDHHTTPASPATSPVAPVEPSPKQIVSPDSQLNTSLYPEDGTSLHPTHATTDVSPTSEHTEVTNQSDYDHASLLTVIGRGIADRWGGLTPILNVGIPAIGILEGIAAALSQGPGASAFHFGVLGVYTGALYVYFIDSAPILLQPRSPKVNDKV